MVFTCRPSTSTAQESQKSDNSQGSDIINHEEPPKLKRASVPRDLNMGLEKRANTFCWGYFLNQPGIDGTANDLADFCGNFGHEIDTTTTNIYATVISEGAMVYYCVDAHPYNGNC
jgi:hypothetical protein